VIYDPAVGGVIPPFDQLRENYFNVDLASGGSESDFATGHLTSFPVVRRTPGNSVPESGSPPGVIRLGTSRLGPGAAKKSAKSEDFSEGDFQ